MFLNFGSCGGPTQIVLLLPLDRGHGAEPWPVSALAKGIQLIVEMRGHNLST